MKKIIPVLVLVLTLMMSFVSCNIEVARPFMGDLTLTVTGLPESVKAVALYCNLNEWKSEKVNGTSFVQKVVNGKVTFSPADVPSLKGYIYSNELQCQFVPLINAATVLDGSWWNKAISGSATYANTKNNLVYNFASRGATNPMTLSLDVSAKVADILIQRIHFENFKEALEKKIE